MNEGKPPCDCCYAKLTFNCPVCKQEITVYEMKYNRVALIPDMDEHIRECKKRRQCE